MKPNIISWIALSLSVVALALALTQFLGRTSTGVFGAQRSSTPVTIETKADAIMYWQAIIAFYNCPNQEPPNCYYDENGNLQCGCG